MLQSPCMCLLLVTTIPQRYSPELLSSRQQVDLFVLEDSGVIEIIFMLC